MGALGQGRGLPLALVFDRGDGAPLHPDRVSKLFQRMAKEAGLPVIRFHDARHTAATLMLSAGMNPKVVSERLGHATIAITLDTYSHVLPNMQEVRLNRRMRSSTGYKWVARGAKTRSGERGGAP